MALLTKTKRDTSQVEEDVIRIPSNPEYTRCDYCPFRNQKKVPSVGDIHKCKYVLVGEAVLEIVEHVNKLVEPGDTLFQAGMRLSYLACR